jgi:hypothetical protein
MFHRLAVAIEAAGFEIRDLIAWGFASGFPTSPNVSKAIDKAAGAEREGLARSRETVYDITAPATEAAKQWEGWGTALKPSHEPVLVARKPLPADAEQCIIVENLVRLESQLWSMLPASIAEQSFKLSQAEYDAACDSARWSADERRSTWADLFGQMDTSQCVSVMSTCLSIVTSWNSTLAEHFGPMSMSTIATASSPTIDWKTLKLYSSALTPRTIIQAAMDHGGSWLHALPAVRYLNAACLSISSTHELSVLESAIEQGHVSRPDGIAKGPIARPIIMARKPLSEKTVAANVLKWGTGGINVDATRIPSGDDKLGGGRVSTTAEGWDRPWKHDKAAIAACKARGDAAVAKAESLGRWPANLVLTYPEDEYTLRDDVTPGQLHQLAEWMNENAER